MAAPQPPVPETLEELNARIDLIELRVVRRDMEFRHHAQSLKARGQALMAPSHWLRPVLGVGSGWLFWRLLRRRPRRHGHREGASDKRPPLGAGLLSGLLGSVLGAKAAEAATPDTAPRGAAAGGGHGSPGGTGHDGKAKPELAMLQMLTMAWGFMPARIRGSLGPDTTQLLLGLVAGLVQGMQQKRKARSEAPAASAATGASASSAPSAASATSPTSPAMPAERARAASPSVPSAGATVRTGP